MFNKTKKKETPKAEKKASETAKPAPAKKQEKEYEPTEEEIARGIFLVIYF